MRNGSYFNSIKIIPFDHMDKHDEHCEGEDTSHHLPQIHTHLFFSFSLCWYQNSIQFRTEKKKKNPLNKLVEAKGEGALKVEKPSKKNGSFNSTWRFGTHPAAIILWHLSTDTSPDNDVLPNILRGLSFTFFWYLLINHTLSF